MVHTLVVLHSKSKPGKKGGAAPLTAENPFPGQSPRLHPFREQEVRKAITLTVTVEPREWIKTF